MSPFMLYVQDVSSMFLIRNAFLIMIFSTATQLAIMKRLI